MKLECLLLFPIPRNFQSATVLKLVGARNVLPHRRIKRAFGFLQNVKMTRWMMNGSRCFVCAGLFDETIPFCVSFDGSKLDPINTSSVSDTPRCSFVHVVTRHVRLEN